MRAALFGDLDELPRRRAFEAGYGAEFTTVGTTAEAEYVAHIPSVRLRPGPQGVRSVTVHGESWPEVLDALDEIIGGDPSG